MKRQAEPTTERPQLHAVLLSSDLFYACLLLSASDLISWSQETILTEDDTPHNPDHAHTSASSSPNGNTC